MKIYISKIYDEIIEKRKNTDVQIAGASGIRIILQCGLKILNQFRLQLLTFFKHNPHIEGKDVAIILTANQLRSIGPLSRSPFFVVRPYLDSIKTEDANPLFFNPYLYLTDLCAQLKYFCTKEGVSWKQIYTPIAYYYYYKSYKRLFNKNRPKSITIANPSHPILRSAILAAADLKIPTIYLPHASASPLYPTISTDYALLEGIDAMDVYKFTKNTKKLLVGSPRLDPFKLMEANPHEGVNILIAANLLDDMNKVLDLCKQLKLHLDTCNCNLLFRPHPNLTINKTLFENMGIEVISSREETCLQSMQRSDVLISANSTIFFEAIYLPIRCYYYDFIKDGILKDSYNFSSYSFIHHLDLNGKIDITPYHVTKEESDRIDVTIKNKKNSIDSILEFYKKLK